jgi:primosomal protein N' (replication factor Y)
MTRAAWHNPAVRAFADVLPALPVDRPFTYLVPGPWRDRIAVGSRVVVPFRSRTVSGFVVGFTDQTPAFEAKPIDRVVGEGPAVDSREFELAKWIAERYLCGWGEALEAMVPSGVKREVAGRTVQHVRLKDPTVKVRSPKHRHVLDALRSGGGDMPMHALLQKAETRGGSVRWLAKHGGVEIYDVAVDAESFFGVRDETPPDLALTAHQEQALGVIREALSGTPPRVVLLHGVTGSGKTEVYLRAIQELVARGRQAIVLVPEIALTPQMVARFRSRFPRTAVLHSMLSEGERADRWRACRAGQVDVVVGARSAVFAPVPKLGLVVVDEEHEPGYKQEGDPRYHARDVAVRRAEMEGAAVVLGSATPSLESLYRARRGVTRIARLPERIGARQMPLVEIVDMVAEARETRRVPVISRSLAQAVQKAHARGEQSILFLNRRGYVTYVSCKRCDWAFRCKHCDVGMTYHKERAQAECHQCFAAQPMPAVCPDCGSPALNLMSLGTEKIEEEVGHVFPGYRVARMDSDAMRSKRDYRDALAALGDRRTDVLVGTQMIAKGLDYPNVTVVGVVTADTAFHHPDFRASERTFQLLTQVAGRAGRGPRGGRVVVQTWHPAHYAITRAAAYDTEGFVDRELTFRQELGYPPFGELVRIVLSGAREEKVKEQAEKLGAKLREALPPLLAEILGPAAAPIARIRNRWRYHFLIKTKDLGPVREELRRRMKAFAGTKAVKIEVDVDPVQMS